MIPAPWSFEYDPCPGKDPFTGDTYGRDFPITGNVPGSSLDGDGDYKPCFCRVKFAPSIPLAEQHDMAKLMAAAPVMFEALREIASRGPVPGYETAGALLLRLVGSQVTARQALEAAKPDNAKQPLPGKAEKLRVCNRCRREYRGSDLKGFEGLCPGCAVAVDAIINH